MRDIEDVLVWEYQAGRGKGGMAFDKDPVLVRTLQSLRPDGLDLEALVKNGSAMRVGDSYVLTRTGFEGFLWEAEQQHNSEIVKYLKQKKLLYWFRNASETQIA